MWGRVERALVIDPTRWREGMLTLMLKVAATLGFIVCVPSVYLSVKAGLFGVAVVDAIAVAGIVALLVFDQLPYRLRAWLTCGMMYMVGAALLVWVGPVSEIYLFCFSILTALLLGLRAGLVAAVFSSATLFVIGLAGLHAADMGRVPWEQDPLAHAVTTLNFALVDILLTLGIGVVLTTVDTALQREIATTTTLERERAALRTILDAQPDVVFTKDTQSRYTHVNATTLAVMQLQRAEQVLGKTDSEIFPAAIAAAHHDEDRLVLAGGRLTDHEERIPGPEGTTALFLTQKVPQRDDSGAIVGLVGVSHDITARRELEDQLRQAQKMEAVGQLAGGVAHDFNNLLTVILGYSEVLLTEPGTAETQQESAKAISEAGERAAALTRQLLAFSRRTMLQPKVLDLNAVVTDTSNLLRRLIGEDIHFTTSLHSRLHNVRVDPGQLTQVLMNMAVNARDAMPKGGRLTIETANVELTEHFAASHLGAMPGPHVMLAMTDSGQGMTPEVRARIFEPFFTTKAVGVGTGLGLAMVFGIVQQSGGTLDVESAPGAGSTFRIYLPAVRGTTTSTPAGGTEIDLRGTETIVLVEDDDAVRVLAQNSLRSLGYQVLSASDGAQAIESLEAHPGEIDMLLTDVVMPDASGPELAHTLRRRHPTLKVLFMSGYSDDAVLRHGLLHDDMSLIQKPYTPLALAQKVRQTLDA